MTGKSLVLAALQRQPTARVPWVPFVGVHGASLIGVNATDYLQSADHLVAGLEAAHRRYRPDGLPVVFDLQLEAEVLGCDLHWAPKGPPSVMSHPLAGGIDLGKLPAFSTTAGRFPVVAEATRRLVAGIGRDTALFGLITGPFTLALHLRGNDIFLDMYDEEARMDALLAYTTRVAEETARFYLELGCDVIAVVDPMTSQISPAHFTRFIAPGLNQVCDAIRTAGGQSSLFVCGDATRNLEVMCQTSCDSLSIDENINLTLLRTLADRHGKSFGGNLRLTTVLLLGTTEDAMRDTLRCLDIAEAAPGFILAPGCDLPFDTPPANLEAVAALVHEPFQREVARQIPDLPADEKFDDIVPPDYAAERRVIIDVVSLDSATCAPCQYMLDAAQRTSERLSFPLEVREHKITGRDGLGYMIKLGVAAIPSICIDGRPTFASVIPDLDAAVTADATAKGLVP